MMTNADENFILQLLLLMLLLLLLLSFCFLLLLLLPVYDVVLVIKICREDSLWFVITHKMRRWRRTTGCRIELLVEE